MSGYVYFIQGSKSGLIKIGHSQDPRARHKTLRTMGGEPIVLLAYTPGARQAETELHQRFQQQRRHGEWFSPSPELLEIVKASQWVAAEQRILTVKQTANYLQKSLTWVYRHAAQLGASKIDHELRFQLADIQAYLDRTRLAGALPTPIRPSAITRGLMQGTNPVTGKAWESDYATTSARRGGGRS